MGIHHLVLKNCENEMLFVNFNFQSKNPKTFPLQLPKKEVFLQKISTKK